MLRWMMLLTTLSLMAPLASSGAPDGDGAAEPKACRVSLVNPSGCSCSRTDSLLGDNLVWPRYALLRAAAAPRRAPDGAVGLRHRPTQMA